MAKLIVLAIMDTAVAAFNRPFFVPARGAGIRAFIDEVGRKDPNNAMSMHPADFALYELGTWDEESGLFESNGIPTRIALATDFCQES